ncbi:MAG: RNA polymerase sporulation sigma factor SigE [Clostridiales bacterium]|nr:RNA polymerase sporulation sigma factor SigE [Clostridiales bacterium]
MMPERILKLLLKAYLGLPKGLAGGELEYLGAGESLPPPLSKEEEAEALARLAGGDENAKTLLIEHNLRLVVYIARRFENTGAGIEDLISIGAIGLIKAVNTFSADRSIKLATYASRCIENEILMYLRKANRIRLEVSLDEPLNVDWDGNELLLSDVLGTDDDLVSKDLEDETDRELLKEAMSRLGPREREIVELRYGLKDGREYTQKQVADLLGISQSYISRLEKRIMVKLYKEMQAME